MGHEVDALVYVFVLVAHVASFSFCSMPKSVGCMQRVFS
jgi:hypothetical protein